MKGMRTMLLIGLVGLCAFSVAGQDTTYFEKGMIFERPILSDFAGYYVITKAAEDTNYVVVEAFDDNNVKRVRFEFYPFNPPSARTMTGMRQMWNEDGVMVFSMSMQEGLKHGPWYTYWPNGKVKRYGEFFLDSLVFTQVRDESGELIEPFPIYVPPMLEGKPRALSEYLNKNMKYPAVARRNGWTDTVVVSFNVHLDGTTSNIRLNPGCKYDVLNKEALRLIRSVPKFSPAIFDGTPVAVDYKVRIVFTLP